MVSEDVEEATAFMMEHFSYIRTWILQRANSPSEKEKVHDGDEDVVISLTMTNPQVVGNVSQFDYCTRSFQKTRLR